MTTAKQVHTKDERTQLEPDVHERAELYQLLTENTNDFIRLHDLDGRSVYASRSVERLYGRVPATMFEFAHPEDLESCRQWWERIRTGGKDRLHWRIRDADQNWRWMETSAALVQYRNRPHILTVCRDVTGQKKAEDVLRRNEQLLAEAARIAHVGFWEHNFDADGRITITWSDETCRIVGFPPGQGPRAFVEYQERIHPDDRPIHAEAFAQAQRGEAPYDLEFRVVRPHGEVRFVHSVGEVIRDKAGRPRRAFGIVQDITERKQAEMALRRSEELLRAVADGTTDAVFVKDREGRYLLCNVAASQLVGKPVSEVIGRDDTAIFDPGSARLAMDHDRQVMQSGAAVTQEEALTAGGVTRIYLATKAPYRDDRGNIVGLIGISRDITDRKRAEAALRDAEQRLRHVVASNPAVLFTLQVRDGELQGIDWMSENVETMLGYRVEETLGADWWLSNIHPEDREAVIGQFRSDIFSRGYSASDYRIRHKDGQYRWVRGEARLLRNAGGQPTEVVGSLSEITERKRLEDQFRQAQKMEAIGTLAGGVAHDFNNLITAINVSSDLILGGLQPDDPLRDLVTEIHKAGDRAGSLTRQLLMFSRQQVIEPKVFDLNIAVADIKKMLRRLIGEDIILTIALDPSLAPVKADPGQLEQVLMNLSVNARDAMPQGGKLVIETRNVVLDGTYAATHPGVRSGEYVMLAVSDTGTGMDPQTKGRIFEPFFTTKERGKGTGLGLAVIHGIVRQSGGHIDVCSEVGKGTEFKIYLPVVKGQAPASQPHAPSLMPRGAETVLLVEDEDSVRKLVGHILRSCGYTVLEAADGLEAIRVAEGHSGKIDLLVSDVVMPHLGGRELAERLATVKPGMKVLFLSGYTDDAVIRHGVLEAEFAFLQKPFTPATLAQKARESLDKKP